MRAFAANVFVAKTLAFYMPKRQTRQTMRLVDFQHITLQHGVVHKALHLHIVIRHHVAVVFDVLTKLQSLGVFKPRLEFGKHLVHR